MIGDRIDGFDETVKVWYAKYKIFFRRSAKNNIRVLRIRGCHQKPVQPKEG
jgi:hypothetical protein